jgi:tetratricopeptide (TPR) repeat protein
MSRIFISYRRVDSPAEAGRIYDYLEKTFGQSSIFKDVDAIDFGDDFRNRIQQAVGQCEILLAVIGKTWLQVLQAKTATNQTDWVKLEIETALARDIRVIPVLLDGVDMPASEDLPSSLQPLTYRNAARVRHDPDFRSDMARLQKRIESNLSPLTPPQGQATWAERLSAITQPITNYIWLSAINQSFFPKPSPRPLLNSGGGGGGERPNTKESQGRTTLAFEPGRSKKSERPSTKDGQGAILPKPSADSFLTSGLEKYNAKDYHGAIADYDTAIRLNPDFAMAYSGRGNAKKDLGDRKGALADYDTAIRLDPDFAIAYNNRGAAKRDLGDKQGAIVDYDTAIRLNPDFAMAYSGRGNAKKDLGDRKGALADYDTAIRLNPNFADAYSGRGAAKKDLGDKQGAIADYLEAAKLYQRQGNTVWFNHAMNDVKKLQN